MKGKQHVRRIPATWWLRKRSYTLFMIRELTALFIAGYAVFLLVLVYKARQGPRDIAFIEFFAQRLFSPVSIVLQVIALLMAIYHTITFFNLSGRVMVVWRGEEKVKPALIVAPNYIAWLVVSALVAWAATRG